MIQFEGRKHQAAAGYAQVGIAFASAKIARVFKFHFAECGERVHVPVREGKSRFQFCFALGRFDKTDAARASTKEQCSESVSSRIVRHVGFADGTTEILEKVCAG